jgi:arsenite methyltransferase
MNKDDKWSKWLLETRFGDSRSAEEGLKALRGVRDALLDKAQLQEGMTLLDVGAGNGLIAFGALEKLGTTGKVILADISEPLLERARASAAQMNVIDQCDFVKASAENLSAVANESIDIVTTRSVLIFVADKARALCEFYRVLRPGGRIALFETVHLPELHRPAERWTGLGTAAYPVVALEPVNDLVARFTSPLMDKPEANTMKQSNHFDYLRLCEDSGFTGIEIQLRIYSFSHKENLETVVNQSPNPLFPTPAEHMKNVFSPEERQRFLDHMRPLIEQGTGTTRLASVYIWASKPAN